MNFTHRTSHGGHGDGDATSLGSEAKNMLELLKTSHSSIFEEPDYPVPRDTLFQHEIKLKDPRADPPRKKLYPLDAVELAVLKE